ncbi:MAG: amidohydrolase [Chloroflexi bacterium]|nr:amidohydrolase [Chloroflexota bacterium]
MHPLLAEANDLFEYTRALRRDFHRHPELAFEEARTAGIVARELSTLGMEVTSGIAETGVIALLEGARPGPTLLARFDMDALRVIEATGAEYASQTPGIMHACGHDGHVAVGLTVARLLHAHSASLAGRVKFVFQPGEEGAGGAARMIAEGVLENPQPDYALALHLWNEKPLGWLGVSAGPVMAACENVALRISGKGGHGGVPHLAIDPVLAAAHVIVALQAITARNVSPLQAAVVTVASIHGGETFNVIPPAVNMQGTIRTFDKQVRQDVLRRFEQTARGVAEALGCQAEVEFTPISPAVVNQPQAAERVRQAARELFPDAPPEGDYRSMVAEDMAFILEQIPGCYFYVGSANPEKGLDAPHHHPRFDIDEDALPRAAALMAAAAMQFLS